MLPGKHQEWKMQCFLSWRCLQLNVALLHIEDITSIFQFPIPHLSIQYVSFFLRDSYLCFYDWIMYKIVQKYIKRDTLKSLPPTSVLHLHSSHASKSKQLLISCYSSRISLCIQVNVNISFYPFPCFYRKGSLLNSILHFMFHLPVYLKKFPRWYVKSFLILFFWQLHNVLLYGHAVLYQLTFRLFLDFHFCKQCCGEYPHTYVISYMNKYM